MKDQIIKLSNNSHHILVLIEINSDIYNQSIVSISTQLNITNSMMAFNILDILIIITLLEYMLHNKGYKNGHQSVLIDFSQSYIF